MMERKTIAVVGATGAQAAARSGDSRRSTGRLRRGERSRGIRTREARELAALCAEVVAADVDQPERSRRRWRGLRAYFARSSARILAMT